MAFDKKTLVVPDGTIFEEHLIVTTGDVVLGDHARTEYGIRATGRVFLGESVHVGGGIHATGDVRADLFCVVEKDVESGGSVYLGERARVAGKLAVGGDLDVGDDVRIEGGFAARGWINIRNPIPMVIYMFVYLLQLLGQGKSQEVERILEELEDGETEFLVGETFLFLPGGSFLGLTDAVIKGNMDVGRACRLLGNFEVRGFTLLGEATGLHGALRSDADVTLGDLAEVHGDLACGGLLRIGSDCHIHGNVRARVVEMKQTALIDGTIQATDGIRFLTAEYVGMKDKVAAFESGRQEIQGLLQ